MYKPLMIPSFLAILLMSTFSCQPTGNGTDPETEKLQREVDSLRQVKEALKDELNEVKEEDAPRKNTPEAPSNAADGPLDGLTVLSAKKQFDANFNPILRITFRNYATKSISAADIAVDFSFNSDELSPNCHFDKKISLSLAPDANQTVNLPIPAEYGKNCADKAWVVVKEVVFSDGSKK
jgi:hypothetical protein